jgi:hypothetical protein
LVNVPLFINEGDKIKIDTASGNYMERVREWAPQPQSGNSEFDLIILI